MDLWIRSQDKHNLVKVNNLSISHDFDYKDNEHYYTIQEHEYSTELGYYETKERALEVLDEIQNILKLKIIYTQKEPIGIYELGAYQIKQDLDMKIQKMNTYVYEMPEK